jgi:hypothetical protein
MTPWCNLVLDNNLTGVSIIYRGINKKTVNEQSIGLFHSPLLPRH